MNHSESVLAIFALSLATACAANGVSPGDHRVEIPYGGRARSYIAHVPPQRGRALPVVINLHGGGGNAANQQKYSLMDALADRAGFIAVYPNGTGRFQDRLLTWNAGTCCGPAAFGQVDDVGFIAAVLDDLAARTPIDATRVFATGLSNGAMMAYRLAAELPDRIAAIAPVAGTMVLANANPRRPVPILHIHSVDDPRALYAGGLGPPFPLTTTRVFHPPVAETLSIWRKANQCRGEPETIKSFQGGNQTASLLAYRDCAAPLEHWRLTGAGHVWPGGVQKYLPGLLGQGTTLIDANAEMWRFFSREASDRH